MKTCKVEGCNNKHYAKGYCRKHYQQIKKHGKIFKSYRDLNEIVIYDDYAEIILCDRNGNEITRTKIDLDDIDKVKDYKWCLENTHNYAYNSKNRLKLHRLITNCPDNKMVDHINGDRLDNRKSNLRIVTQHQNNMNTSISKNNKSGFKGVYWSSLHNKWRADIGFNYKTIHLGLYDNIEDAIKARKEAELKYFGEYRNKNNEEYED